jgi:hypothetical protein
MRSCHAALRGMMTRRNAANRWCQEGGDESST